MLSRGLTPNRWISPATAAPPGLTLRTVNLYTVCNDDGRCRMDEIPYLMRGRREVATDSSVLVSSSKFLNDPRFREFVTTENLRRNGRDYPMTYGYTTLISAVREVQDQDRIEDLFKAARRGWP